MTFSRHGGEIWRRCETPGDKVVFDHLTGPISMRNTSMIMRWVVREYCLQCRRYRMGELVLLDSVPHIEHKNAARSKHSAHLRERSRFVRKKHDAKLTNNSVKGSIGKGERDDVGLAP